MSFKPHRDSRPLEQRPLSVQLEAQFHMAIRDKLTKRQQGHVMGAFREVLAKLSLDAQKAKEQALFEVAVAAILDTSVKAFAEGYREAFPEECEVDEDSLMLAWGCSECFKACTNMITTLSGGDNEQVQNAKED